VINNEVIDS